MKTLRARRLLTGTGEIAYPVITVEDGLIACIEASESSPKQPDADLETLAGTFFDIHVHGARTHDFLTATLPEIDAVGRFRAGHGVGHYLATTVTGPLELTFRALERLADAVEKSPRDTPAIPTAVPVGIHLEGPFVSHAKRGVHPAACLLEPSVELFQRMQQAARGHIRLITLAPELPGARELTAYATRRGVRVSMGHSNATAAETLAAIDAGATSATHLFNAMRALDHREPGILGTILDREEVYAEAICDGVHVHPAMVRLWLKIKGAERAILVTDGMSATGMPDGTYMLGDFPVEVRNGVCLAGETLAGSVLTMDRAVENVQRFTGTSLEVALRLASRNPARMLGLEHLAAVAVGQPANFSVYSAAGERVGQIFRGVRQFAR
jgi:N-acetylglucosamine-6-phosphate deacetylase